MADMYWMKLNVEAGKVGGSDPMWKSPQEWVGLSYEDLLALQAILHGAQGELLNLSKEKAKGKK